MARSKGEEALSCGFRAACHFYCPFPIGQKGQRKGQLGGHKKPYGVKVVALQPFFGAASGI